MFSFNASWDRAEYIRADRATARYRLSGRWRNWIPVVGPLLFIMVCVLPVLFLGIPWSEAGNNFLPLGALFLGLPALNAFLVPWLKVRALAKHDPDLADGYKRVVDAEGIKMVGRSSSVAITWERLKQVRETPEFFLFYFNPASAYYLPKRAIATPELFASLRSYLPEQIAGRAMLL